MTEPKKHGFRTFECLEAVQSHPYWCVSHLPRSPVHHSPSGHTLHSNGRTWSSHRTYVFQRRCRAACRILDYRYTMRVVSEPTCFFLNQHSRMPSSQVECSGQIPSVSLSVLLLCCT